MAVIVVKLGDNVVQRYRIEKDVVSIGRARDNDIVVENLSVSRNHARIRLENSSYVLTDLNSANGCFVNGVKLTKAELAHDDLISIGKHKLHFALEDTDAPGSPAAASAAPPAASGHAPAAPPAGSVVSEGEVAVLIVTRGKQANAVFQIDKPVVTIGRSNENDIRLYDWHVSKCHAAIYREDDRFRLKDLGSWRGSTVNNVATSEILLTEDDEIIFGTTVMTFKIGPAGSFAEQATMDSENIRFDTDFAEGQTGMEDGEVPDSASVPLASETPGGDAILPDSPDDSFDVATDDEFAPMTDEELEALEQEDGEAYDVDPELARQAEFEQMEADKLLAEGGGWESMPGGLVDAKAEDAAADGGIELAEDVHSEEDDDSGAVDEEEEQALFGGPVTDSEAGVASGTAAAEPQVPEGVDPEQVRIWTRALRNRSKVVRREAARKLKELTGMEYDWESEPE